MVDPWGGYNQGVAALGNVATLQRTRQKEQAAVALAKKKASTEAQKAVTAASKEAREVEKHGLELSKLKVERVKALRDLMNSYNETTAKILSHVEGPNEYDYARQWFDGQFPEAKELGYSMPETWHPKLAETWMAAFLEDEETKQDYHYLNPDGDWVKIEGVSMSKKQDIEKVVKTELIPGGIPQQKDDKLPQNVQTALRIWTTLVKGQQEESQILRIIQGMRTEKMTSKKAMANMANLERMFAPQDLNPTQKAQLAWANNQLNTYFKIPMPGPNPNALAPAGGAPGPAAAGLGPAAQPQIQRPPIQRPPGTEPPAEAGMTANALGSQQPSTEPQAEAGMTASVLGQEASPRPNPQMPGQGPAQLIPGAGPPGGPSAVPMGPSAVPTGPAGPPGGPPAAPGVGPIPPERGGPSAVGPIPPERGGPPAGIAPMPYSGNAPPVRGGAPQIPQGGGMPNEFMGLPREQQKNLIIQEAYTKLRAQGYSPEEADRLARQPAIGQ